MKFKKTSHFPSLLFLLIVFIFVGFTCLVLYTQTKSNVLGATDTIVSSCIKEVYIPLGTGLNMTTDWVDVGGAAASVNTGLYGKMKKITFEASIGVPSGNQTVSVRLYNATDKHPVWYSDMTMSGAGPTLLISSPLTVDSGNKVYQVQMKSQLGAQANLLQSRIHIILY